MARHVIKGDEVIVTAGKFRGRTGKIVQVMPDRDLVVIQGINLRTKHLKPTRINPQGGIITKEMPIHVSNVSPVVDGRATRVRFVSRDDGSKVRVAVRGGAELSVLRKPTDKVVAVPKKKRSTKKAAK